MTMMSKEYAREYGRKWRAKNREKLREYQREYQRVWKKANRDKCNLTKRRWVAKNPEKAKEGERKWLEANRERVRVKHRVRNQRYALKNPEKMRLKQARRRERVRKANPCDQVSANLLCQLISNPSKLKCGICGKNMPKNDRTIDHVIPLSKGGTGEIWNLRIVHLQCNLKKAATMPEELKL